MGFIGGPLVIDTVGGAAKVNFGGALFITRKSVAKVFGGAGGGHTAAVSFSFTGPNSTNTIDSNVIEQPITKNN